VKPQVIASARANGVTLKDKILGRYGKEMTWDIKAGCMGKREIFTATE